MEIDEEIQAIESQTKTNVALTTCSSYTPKLIVASTTPTTCSTVDSTPTSFDFNYYGGINGTGCAAAKTIYSPADSSSDAQQQQTAFRSSSNDLNKYQPSSEAPQQTVLTDHFQQRNLFAMPTAEQPLKNFHCGSLPQSARTSGIVDYPGLLNDAAILSSLLQHVAASMPCYGNYAYPSLINQLTAEALLKKYLAVRILSSSNIQQSQPNTNSANLGGCMINEPLPTLPVVASTLMGDKSTSNYVSF